MRRFFAAVLLLSLGIAPAPLVPLGCAQPPGAAPQAAIDEVYAAMFAALEAGVFARARNLCDQVILWEPANPVHRYNLACIEARAGPARRDHAVAALERAVELGFADATHARGDPDLASLHRDPRFAALLSRMDAARAALAPAAPAPAAPAGPVAAVARLPRGLFLAAPAGSPPGFAASERTVWFFAEGGAVVLDPLHGTQLAAETAPSAGRRATAALAGEDLSVTWSDGTAVTAKLTPASPGFVWNGLVFAPVSATPAPGQLAGRYRRGPAFSLRANLPATPVELSLAADGRAEWQAGDSRLHTGRWLLRDHTLELADAAGSAARFLLFAFRADPAPDTPPLLYVGGFVFERQP